jgi:hypothetical protein
LGQTTVSQPYRHQQDFTPAKYIQIRKQPLKNSKIEQKPDLENCQWIGLRENLQENPIFSGKIYGFLWIP